MSEPGDRRGGSAAPIAFGLVIAVYAAFAQFKLPVVLPVMLERYGYDRIVAGGFMSVFALSGLLLSVRIGRAIERHGTMAPVLLAIAALAAGSLLALASPEHQLVVLLARALEGVGFTILAIAGPVLAHGHASAAQLPLVIGLSAAWIPIGQLVASGLAPLAATPAGWQALWWTGLAGGAVLAWWTVHLGDRRAVPGPCARTPRTAVASAPDERLCLGLGAGVFMLWSTQFIGFATWLPQYLVEGRGLALGGALQGYVLLVALVMVFNLVGGLALRAGIGLAHLLVAGLLAQSTLWWLAPLASADGTALALLVVFGAGAGVVPTCLFGVPSTVSGSATSTARGFGALMTGRNLGVLVGPILLATVVEASGRWESVGVVFGTITVGAAGLGGVLAWQMGRLPGKR